MEKHSVSRLSYLFSHLQLLSSYSFSSTLLSSNLSLLSASSLLCFSSVHIVGSLTSKLPSIIIIIVIIIIVMMIIITIIINYYYIYIYISDLARVDRLDEVTKTSCQGPVTPKEAVNREPSLRLLGGQAS